MAVSNARKAHRRPVRPRGPDLHPRDITLNEDISDDPPHRHLAYTHGAPEGRAVMILLDDTTGATVHRYACEQAFNRIERHGEWWRLQGRDRATGELIYTRETVA